MTTIGPKPFAQMNPQEIQAKGQNEALYYNRTQQLQEQNAATGSKIDPEKEKRAIGAQQILNILV